MRLLQICLLVLFVCSAWPLGDSALADTIYLKNGQVLHGKVVQLPDKSYRVQFNGKGSMLLKEQEVERHDTNDLDAFSQAAEKAAVAPAGLTQPVLVTLKRGNNYYGPGSYFGWPESSEEEPVLVLTLPGGGKLRIPREHIHSMEKVETPEAGETAAVEGSPTAIATTDVVYLKNGRTIRGNQVPTEDPEIYQVRVGNLGVMTFPKDKVARIEKEAGSYQLPESRPTEGEETAAPKTMEEIRQELKEEIRREILKELLDAAIDEQIDKQIERIEGAPLGAASEIQALDPQELLDIQFHVRELGRQRTINRVRAEAALKRLGPAVVPFLGSAAVHPFALTRRAVQRIIAEIGDARSAPLAIEALNDADPFVRRLAHEALRKIVGEVRYSADASEAQRRTSQERYRELWRSQQREALRQTVAKS